MPPLVPPAPTPVLTLETPVVLPAGWTFGSGDNEGTAPGPRRVLLRDVLLDLERGSLYGRGRVGVVDLAGVLVEAPAGEVLGDDSPTTTAINAVARRLTALQRQRRAEAGR